LSAAGKLFLTDARRILQEVEEAKLRAERVAKGKAGTLRVGFMETISWHGVVPESLRRFRKRQPDIELELHAMRSLLQIEGVKSGRLDAGYVFSATGVDGDLSQVGNEVTTKDVGKDAVTIAPAALTRRASIERPHELTAIFLDPLMFSEIARAETGMCYPEIMPQFAIVDPVIRSLGMALDEEMRSTNPKPASYGERLVTTLASHHRYLRQARLPGNAEPRATLDEASALHRTHARKNGRADLVG
jgi:hypothetical protein